MSEADKPAVNTSADRGDLVSGALLLTLIGLGWIVAGLSALGSMPLAVLGLPAAVFALLLVGVFALRRKRRGLPPTLPDVDRAIGRATAWEVAAILVVVAGVNVVHQARWMMPGIAVVVGLHFFPVAAALNRPLYRLTGAALCAVGIAVPLLVPTVLGPRHASGWMLGVGIGGGTVLWLTVLALLARGYARLRHTLPTS